MEKAVNFSFRVFIISISFGFRISDVALLSGNDSVIAAAAARGNQAMLARWLHCSCTSGRMYFAAAEISKTKRKRKKKNASAEI